MMTAAVMCASPTLPTAPPRQRHERGPQMFAAAVQCGFRIGNKFWIEIIGLLDQAQVNRPQKRVHPFHDLIPGMARVGIWRIG